MNGSRYLETEDDGRIAFHFICEACDEEGRLTLPVPGTDFNCPNCESRYIAWKDVVRVSYDPH